MREKLSDVLPHGVIFSIFAAIITVYFRERNDYNYKCRHKNDKERNRMKNYLKFVSAILIAAVLSACSTGGGADNPTAGTNNTGNEVTPDMTSTTTPDEIYGKSGLLKNSTVVFTGDSITDGYRVDRSDPNDLGKNNYVTMFNDFIQTNFPEDNIKVYNTGHSGYWIQHLHDAVQSFVYDLDPDYLIVNIGTNNAWFDKSPIETVEKEYRSLIDELMAKTHARIVLVQPYLFECDTILDGVPTNEYIPRMNQISDIVCRVAAEKKLPVIFYSEIFRQAMDKMDFVYKPLLSADGIHPSTNGYRMFCDALCTEMKLPGYTPKFRFDFTDIKAQYGIVSWSDVN